MKEFPDNQKLNKLFPNRPVILPRIDGHAAIANSFALNLAGLKPGQKIVGGEIETINGKLTGILVDNAEGLVFSKVPPPSAKQISEALLDAQKNCFAVGLTTVTDCGISHELIPVITDLQKVLSLKSGFMLCFLTSRPIMTICSEPVRSKQIV